MYVPIEVVRAKMADYQREAERQRLVAEFRKARAPAIKSPKPTHQHLRHRIIRRLAAAFRLVA